MNEGDVRRDDGVATVVGNARTGWKRGYEKHAYAFLQQVKVGEEFTGEQIREFAEAHGLGQPHHPNAWGGMANGFLRVRLDLGIVEEVGALAKAKDPTSHSHQYRIYRRLK